MSVDTLIQLGILLITGIATLASGIYFVHKWYLTKFKNLKIEIILLGENRYPFSSLSVNLHPKQTTTSVKSIFAWCKITITNHNANSAILEKILISEDSSPDKQIYSAVKKITLNEQDIKIDTPIEFPLMINGNSACTFYFLAEITIPFSLGKKLSEHYNLSFDHKKLKELSKEIKKGIREQNAKMVKFLGVEVVESKLESFEYNLPTKDSTGKELYYCENFGVLQSRNISNLIMDLAKSAEEYGLLLKSPYKNYNVKAVFSGGVTKILKFAINGSSIWFNKELQCKI